MMARQWKDLMLQTAKIFSVMGLLGLLSACVSHTIPLVKPISCEQRCLKQALMCNEVCQNSCQICQAKSKERARRFYSRYEWVQRAKEKIVARELNAFRDPLACSKVTCDCAADYTACKQVCRGTIVPNIKTKQCIKSEIPCDYWPRDILAG